MTLETLAPHRRWLMPAAVFLALAGLVGAQTALARITRNTIDPVATLTAQGRHVTVTGPIEILPAGETVYLRVTVTQRTTGAVAEGIAFLTGTGAIQQWTVRATTQSRERFEEGAATAVAVARSTERGSATDAHQWLVGVTLVRE
jgi:hypothetical protein